MVKFGSIGEELRPWRQFRVLVIILYGDFLVGFWPGGQKAGVKKCENHTTLQQREVDFHRQGDMRNKVC